MSRSLEQWFAHQGRVHPAAIDLGLGRITAVLERLGWRQPSVPVVTVAGTNGKGSVSSYSACILQAAGLRVGTFTSPHLRDYRERIRLHDRLVTEPELLDAFEQIEAACVASEPITLTFFEYNAIAAFLTFAASGMQAWVLEVGLGGRLDAVNIVDPTVAVVVSIGLDHQEYLGTTREAIAREKAGIFRPDRPAVLGMRDMPVLIDCALARGAKPKRLGVEFDYERRPTSWDYRGSCWQLFALPPPALAGEVQYDNAATAIAALEELAPRLTISSEAVARGLAAVRLDGRFQIIEGTPTWILDVAHNPDAARVLARNLRVLPSDGRTFAVCGILADKDAAGIATELRNSVDRWWLVPIEDARGSSAAALAARLAANIVVPLELATDIEAACAAAAAQARAGDRIVVFGSFHTVGPALKWLESQIPHGGHCGTARDSRSAAVAGATATGER